MRRFLLLASCTTVLLAAAFPSVTSAEVLFNGSSLSSFSAVRGASGAVTEVSDPLGSGQTVFKLTVNDKDVYPASPFFNPRADAVSPALIEEGDEFWMKTKFLLPATFPASVPKWMSLLTIAGPPYEGSRPWEVGIGGETIRWQRNSTYSWDVPWEMPLERSRWISVLLHERFDAAGKGWVEMWIDGERITFFSGSSYNPLKTSPTNQLGMATMDASNNGGANMAFLMNSRPAGMFESATVYFGPLKIGTERSDVVEPLFFGDQISDYAANQSAPGAVTEVSDPAGSGKTVLKMTVSNEDVYPVTPTADPRAQLLSPRVIQPGREYWWRQQFYIPSTMPLVSSSDWFQILQLHGPPYEGPPPFAIKIQEEETGKNWLLWQRNSTYSWDIPWKAPLQTDHWHDLLVHFRFDQEGFVEAWLDGSPLTFFGEGSYNPGEYAETTHLAMQVRDSSNGGEGSIVNNEAIVQSYRKRNIFETATIYFGPVMLSEDRADVE